MSFISTCLCLAHPYAAAGLQIYGFKYSLLNSFLHINKEIFPYVNVEYLIRKIFRAVNIMHKTENQLLLRQ